MLNNPVEYSLMAIAEKRHWWYRVLHEQTIRALDLFIEKNGIEKSLTNILDAGCGTGGLMDKLRFVGYSSVVGADISDYAVEICKRKRQIVSKCDVKELPTKYFSRKYDVIICNDVLCYFTMEEIPAIIEGFKSMLKPGGLLIMNNPAHAAFAGNHDVAVGIVTRFNPLALKRAVASCQLSVVGFSQWPFLLSPMIFLVRKLQRKKRGEAVVSDVSMLPLWLNSLLYSICKLEMKLFKRSPWGSSVFIVAKK